MAWWSGAPDTAWIGPMSRRKNKAVWDETKRQRFQELRGRELEGTLSEAGQSELAHLVQELEDMEAALFRPAIQRMRQENALLQAEAERLTERRQQLAELLGEKKAYLARVR